MSGNLNLAAGETDPKWFYIVCVKSFEVGSAVCGVAPSMNALVIGRMVAGLAGAGQYLGVIMLLFIFTTPSERPAYFTMRGVTFGSPKCLVLSLEVLLLIVRRLGVGPFTSIW